MSALPPDASTAASRLGYELLWPGKAPRARGAGEAPVRLLHTDALDGPSPAARVPVCGRGTGFRNRLLWGDNLLVMEALLPEFRGRIDLVYLDPPFQAGQAFTIRTPLGEDRGMGPRKGTAVETAAYRDVWDAGTPSYLQMLYERLPLVRELLAETGSLIVHVNWQAGHLVQALLDEVFGPGERRGPGQPGFRNEIIWGYGGGGSVRTAYRRKHDNLFWYTRSDRWTFNPQYRPYTEKTRQRGLTTVKGDRYALRDEGAQLQTWWTDPGVQKILSPTAGENLKFPTQKPESLLERLLRGHSHPGDLVADFFCGSGTTGAVAERLGRRWIMADQSRQAIHTSRKRLAHLQARLAAAGQPFCPFDLYRVLQETASADSMSTTEAIGAMEAGVLSAAPVLHPDGTVDVRLLHFEPALPPSVGHASLPGTPRVRARSSFDFIDTWAVDFDYDPVEEPGARVFRHQWSGSRTPRRRILPLQSDAAHRCERPGPRIAGVKVVDVFGRETLILVTIQ